jgi:hypothetical protein
LIHKVGEAVNDYEYFRYRELKKYVYQERTKPQIPIIYHTEQQKAKGSFPTLYMFLEKTGIIYVIKKHISRFSRIDQWIDNR